MSLTEREKEIALACARATGWSDTAHKEVIALLDLFLSRIREEQEPVGYFVCHETGYFEVTDKYKGDPDVIPLFATPPSAPECKDLEMIKKMMWSGTADSFMSLSDEQKRMAFAVGIHESTLRKQLSEDCSELVEALKAYDQIVRITISRLIRQYGKDDDEYAIELRECLGNACEALANHAKRMKGKE